MAKNTVKLDITGDSSNIIQETKKAQGAIRQFGNECKTSSGKIKTIGGELRSEKRIVQELAYQYRNLTDEEKKAFGPGINREIDARIAKVRQLKAEQDKLNTQMGTTAPAVNPLASMQGAMSQIGSQMGLPIANISTLLTSLVNPATAAAAAIAGVGVAVYKIGKAGEEFKTVMNDMQIRLNLSEDQVKSYGDAAVQMGNKFGKSATDIVKQLQYIGQQAPGMEKNKEGMFALAEASNKLAIAMGESTETATNSLLTVFSKFDLQAKDTEQLMNSLFVACQNTGANLEYMGTVFDAVGTKAMTAGVDFQEVAAATAVLSSVEGDASKVGGELAAMFTKLAKAEDKYNPEKVGLVTAIENMKNANLDNAEILDLVGKKGADGAQVLMRQIDALKQMETKIRNTNAAEEAFGVKNAELGQAINRVKAAWENFRIQLADNKLFQQFITYIGNMIEKIAEFITFIGKLADSWDDVGEGISVFDGLAFQMNVTLEVLKTLMSVFNTFAQFISKVVCGTIEAAKNLWNQFKAELSDTDFYKAITWAFEKALGFIKGVINTIINEWKRLKQSLGIDDGGSGKPLGPEDKGLGASQWKKFNQKNNPKPETPDTQNTPTGGKGGGKPTPQPEKPEVIKDSLEWYDNEIKKINDALKKQNLTYEQTVELAQKLAKLERDRKEILDKQEQIKQDQGFSLHDDTKSKIKKEDLQPRKLTDVFVEPEVKDIKMPETINDKLRNTFDKAMERASQVQHDYDIGIISEEKAQEEMQRLQEILDNAGLNAEVHLEVDKKAVAQALNTAADAVGNLGNALSSLGNAFDNKELNVAGIIAGAIANVAAGAAQATLAASQTGNPWVWLAFGIAAMAEMATMIASIHSATGMAEGGIVGGPTTIGDQIYTRLNAGEMVLNRRQQSNLFDALDNGINADNYMLPQTSTVKITGDDMYIQMRNYYKRTKKNPFE